MSLPEVPVAVCLRAKRNARSGSRRSGRFPVRGCPWDGEPRAQNSLLHFIANRRKRAHPAGTIRLMPVKPLATTSPDAVLARVARFLDDLRATPGWNDSEVRLVERGVRRMLKVMVEGDERRIDVSVRQSA